jgi:acyl dehydratase
MDPQQLLGLPPRIVRQTYTRRDTILYALSVGAGHDPAREDELSFVYEEGLHALPSMAVVLAYPGFWQREPQYAIDWKRVLHGEQALELHAPLPVEGTVRGELTVDRIIDKGADKGALLYSTRRIFDEFDNRLLASVRQVSVLRGDGGRGGSGGVAGQPHAVPADAPDMQLSLSTRPEQALLYRLCGDYNPLHIDPAVARELGLPRPILHGLCTYGVATRALVRSLCANEPERIKRVDCRFTAPAFPGDTLEVSIWHETSESGSFRVRATERDVCVLNNGYVEFGGD